MTDGIHSRYPEITADYAFLPQVSAVLASVAVISIIRNVRAFYMLLPRQAMAGTWPDTHKDTRWKIIRDHLRSVCEGDSITMRNITRIDRWLTARSLPRANVSQYGLTLEKKYGKLCFICGKPIAESSTVDHVFPLSWGGTEDIDNLMLAHKECNSTKNNWLPGDSLAWAPNPVDVSIDDVPLRMRYLVFLRDNFSCTTDSCNQSIFTRHSLSLSTRSSTGVCCFDNLRTVCSDHADIEIHSPIPV